MTRPVGDRLCDQIAILEAKARVVEALILAEIGALDQRTEILPLLGRIGTDADPAVTGRLDRRRLGRETE